MAGPTPAPSKPSNAPGSAAGSQAPPKRNPAFRMMGMPNFKFKLPSRNWLIFLSLSGGLASAIFYDRHYKKKAQQKWCRLVSHLADEPLPTSTMPRKLTIFLSAPPADSLKASREYFNDYVKPVLVAGALDWEVIEGRREGDVRAGLAEKIRKLRKQRERPGPSEPAGEDGETPAPEDLVREIRRNNAIKEDDGTRGDIVIGRNTWKEYMRGLHEGWLGPLDPPAPPPSQVTPEEQPPPPTDESSGGDASSEEPKEPPKEPPKPPAKPTPTPAFIPSSLSAYTSSPLPPTFLDPDAMQPSCPIEHPHVLGFLNTPTRLWRFLNRRHLADKVGREAAAVVLATHTRPYSDDPSAVDPSSISASASDPSMDDASPSSAPTASSTESGSTSELLAALAHEESSWHKSIRKRAPPDDAGVSEERVWLDAIVADPRITSRMRRFELGVVEEARARQIDEGKASDVEQDKE